MPKKIKNTPPIVKTVADVRDLMAEVARRYPDADAVQYIVTHALGKDDFTTSGYRNADDLTPDEVAAACAELQEVIECGPSQQDNVVPFRDPAAPSAGSADTADADGNVSLFGDLEGYANNIVLTELSRLNRYSDMRSVNQVCNHWVWCVGIERWVNRLDPEKMWKASQFDSAFNHFLQRRDGGSLSKVLFADRGLIRRFEKPTYSPGRPEFNGRYYNTWRPGKIVPSRGDTSLFDDHLEWLLPDPVVRNHMLDWMAWVYQHQDMKPNYALLLIGEMFGTGKSFVARVLEHLLGLDNTQRPKNSSLNGDFNAWAAHCKLIFIEELMQMGKKEVEGALRDIITEPTIEVNIKNISAYKMPSYSAMMAVSNHVDALPLKPRDRRWLVCESPITAADKEAKKATGHFARLMPMVDNDNPDLEALGAIAYQLQTRKLGDYDARGDAPLTDAKATMIEYGKSPLVTWLDSERENDPFTRRVVSIPDDIVPLIPQHIMREQSSRNHDTTIAKWIKRELDGVPAQAKVGKRVVRVWCINGPAPENVSGTYRAERAGKKVQVDADDADDFMEPAE